MFLNGNPQIQQISAIVRENDEPLFTSRKQICLFLGSAVSVSMTLVYVAIVFFLVDIFFTVSIFIKETNIYVGNEYEGMEDDKRILED